MTAAHEYAVGDRVVVSYGWSDDQFDTVKRVTPASVILENAGTFRRAGMHRDGTLTKTPTGRGVRSTWVYPPGSSRFAQAEKDQRARRRHAAIVGAPVKGIHPLAQAWINSGTDHALDNLIQHLRATQHRIGEPTP